MEGIPWCYDSVHNAELEQAGFHSQANVGPNSWTKVLFQRSAVPAQAVPAPPEGFQIRPLGGAAEVEAYVSLHRAVFQSENMTVGWRRRTLEHPAYRPELDLVLVDEVIVYRRDIDAMPAAASQQEV